VNLTERAKDAVRAVSNIHRQGALPNIFLFATARGGSTWLMEILASQPGMKYYDEPFNIRRKNVIRTGLFPTWDTLMPDSGDPARIVDYLTKLEEGAFAFMNPPPFRPHHRLMTNRIVFKIHELEHLMGHIARARHGQIVYLLRHPIPTSMSRAVLPRLELFLTSTFYAGVIGDRHRLEEIQRLGRTGSKLVQGVVSWCYENVVPLRMPDFDGLVVTYEELVLNPMRSCDLLLNYCNFEDRASMVRAFGEPSTNINMSSAETQAVMSQSDERQRRLYLVGKWKTKVTSEDTAAVSHVMKLFGLDVYTGEALLAHPRYLQFDETATLVDDSQGATVR
jgi:hypothetical protein